MKVVVIRNGVEVSNAEDNLDLKPAAPKITKEAPKNPVPVGNLKVSAVMVPAYSAKKNHSNDKKNDNQRHGGRFSSPSKNTAINNDRSNRRGIVTGNVEVAAGNANFAEVKVHEGTGVCLYSAEDIEVMNFKLSEYDKEYHRLIVVSDDGEVKLTIDDCNFDEETIRSLMAGNETISIELSEKDKAIAENEELIKGNNDTIDDLAKQVAEKSDEAENLRLSYVEAAKDLKKKDIEISKLKGQIANLTKEKDDINKEIDILKNSDNVLVASLKEEAVKKDKSIEELNAKLAEAKKEVPYDSTEACEDGSTSENNLKKEIAAKVAEITELKNDLAKKVQAITSLDELVVQKDATIDQLQKDAEQSKEDTKKSDEIEDFKNKVAALEKMLQEKDEELIAEKQKVSDLTIEVPIPEKESNDAGDEAEDIIINTGDDGVAEASVFTAIEGTLTTFKKLAESLKMNADKMPEETIIVFSDDEDNYFKDQDGTVICVNRIDGKSIDEALGNTVLTAPVGSQQPL